MAYFDMPLKELQTYRPPRTSQPNFEQFWLDTLIEERQFPLNEYITTRDDLPYTGVRFSRAVYAGWQGHEIVGTYAVPEGEGPFPAVVMFHGYSSARPEPFMLLGWILQGYAILAIDMPGQSGESSDTTGYPGGHVPGYMTLGINDPANYYYRGAYVDAVRAVDFLAAQPEVDRQRLFITGSSQGGGLTIATTALIDLMKAHRETTFPFFDVEIRAAVAEIPFLCHFERACTLVDTPPYSEIAHYCRCTGADFKAVFRTLSYFDVMNLASYSKTPTLVTAGLMDMICPPSTIFATYNALQGAKDIIVHTFGEHETFPGVLDARMRWFARYDEDSTVST